MIGEVSTSETRRSFLESTLATAALAGMASPAEAQSRANVTIGMIGVGIRGLELMGVALESWPKDAKDKFIAEQRTIRGRMSGRPGSSPSARWRLLVKTTRGRWSICAISSSACKAGANPWRMSTSVGVLR
jgi:hypothetical protein